MNQPLDYSVFVSNLSLRDRSIESQEKCPLCRLIDLSIIRGTLSRPIARRNEMLERPSQSIERPRLFPPVANILSPAAFIIRGSLEEQMKRRGLLILSDREEVLRLARRYEQQSREVSTTETIDFFPSFLVCL